MKPDSSDPPPTEAAADDGPTTDFWTARLGSTTETPGIEPEKPLLCPRPSSKERAARVGGRTLPSAGPAVETEAAERSAAPDAVRLSG